MWDFGLSRQRYKDCHLLWRHDVCFCRQPIFRISCCVYYRGLSQAHILLTYSLTLWSRVLLEKLTGFQQVKKFHAIYGTRRFSTAITSARHLSLSWVNLIRLPYSDLKFRFNLRTFSSPTVTRSNHVSSVYGIKSRKAIICKHINTLKWISNVCVRVRVCVCVCVCESFLLQPFNNSNRGSFIDIIIIIIIYQFCHTSNIGHGNHNLQFVHYNITYNIWTSAHNTIRKQYQMYNVIWGGSLLLYLDIRIGIYLKVKN